MICVLFTNLSHAFSFLPGLMKPKSFKKGDQLYIKASEAMNDEESISFELFDVGLCKPDQESYPSDTL